MKTGTCCAKTNPPPFSAMKCFFIFELARGIGAERVIGDARKIITFIIDTDPFYVRKTPMKSDERILGDGEFTQFVLDRAISDHQQSLGYEDGP